MATASSLEVVVLQLEKTGEWFVGDVRDWDSSYWHINVADAEAQDVPLRRRLAPLRRVHLKTMARQESSGRVDWTKLLPDGTLDVHGHFE